MPKELILGDRVTVRRGDLPVAQARTRADLAALTRAALDRLADRALATSPTETSASRELRLADAEVRALRAELADQRAAWSILRRRHQLHAEFVDELVNLDGRTTDHVEFTREFRRRAQALLEALGRLPLDGTADNTDNTDADDTDLGWRTPLPDCPRRNLAHGPHTVHRAGTLERDPQLVECPGCGLAPADPDDPTENGPAEDEPRLCDGCGRTNAGAVHPTDDGRALVCADCRTRLDEESEDDPNLPAEDPDAELVLRVALSLQWVREGGQVTIGVIGLAEDNTEVDLGGTFATLDWAAANKLIKKTRVARDQSHGSPE